LAQQWPAAPRGRPEIGLGFAGLGWLGESLLKDLPNFPSVRLAGVQDVRAELARDIAARYGSPWQGTDFEALLAAPGVDAVAICTPNALHIPQALATLHARKHVLVQKPLALCAADAQTAIDLAARTRRLLFVDYTYRFLDTLQALQTHQRVRRLTARFHNIYGPGQDKTWFFDPRLSGGGALVDLGVHLLDLALWLLKPTSVRLERAALSFGARLAVEDGARLELRLDDVPFDLEVSWNSPRPLTEISLSLETDRARLRWENVDGSFFHFRTLSDDTVMADRETTLRADTLRAFIAALDAGLTPSIDVRVYSVLEAALRQP
jgi:predicted dehydrogenase